MWDEIYTTHYPELLRYCAAACKDMALAEDLAQETFLKALQNADTFEDLGPSQRRAWLYRTMKHLIVDRYRRSTLEEQTAQAWQEDAVSTEPGYGTTENQMLLTALSDQDRTLFHLRYEEGYSAKELAEMYGVPPGTIRARLSRSRAVLKRMLSE